MFSFPYCKFLFGNLYLNLYRIYICEISKSAKGCFWLFFYFSNLLVSSCLFTIMKKKWIITQTYIRNTDSYSDTDSEKLDISLNNQLFSLILITVSQRVPTTKLLTKKQVSRNSPFYRQFGAFLRRFSELHDQCPRHSGTLIYRLKALVTV